MSAFKLAKKRTVPEIAADLARLKAEERELRGTRKRDRSAHGVRSALWITRAQISHVKGEKGVGKREKDEGGRRRRTVRRTKMDRRRRR